ncbi:MAG: hypothetical protein Q4C34_06710, partial [Bacteroidales bacterium]|nr:hypothetical protein [Bacteroidales bacterium]
ILDLKPHSAGLKNGSTITSVVCRAVCNGKINDYFSLGQIISKKTIIFPEFITVTGKPAVNQSIGQVPIDSLFLENESSCFYIEEI